MAVNYCECEHRERDHAGTYGCCTHCGCRNLSVAWTISFQWAYETVRPRDTDPRVKCPRCSIMCDPHELSEVVGWSQTIWVMGVPQRRDRMTRVCTQTCITELRQGNAPVYTNENRRGEPHLFPTKEHMQLCLVCGVEVRIDNMAQVCKKCMNKARVRAEALREAEEMLRVRS